VKIILFALISFLLCFPANILADSHTSNKETSSAKKKNVSHHTKATFNPKKVNCYAEDKENNAQTDLGIMYGFGKGVLISDKETLKCFLLAAEQGHMGAQHSLGLMYSNGTGVPQNDREAAKWFLSAAEQGHRDAQDSLGLMYYNGIGIPCDKKEAAKWFLSAAEQGHGDAQLNLGLMYMLGDGVPQDCMQAHMWLALASAQSLSQAKKQREKLEKLMTPDEIAGAQSLTKEWLINHPMRTF